MVFVSLCEINYIIEKLIPERELEDKLVKRVLESVKNFDGKDKIAIKLNEDFLQEFNDFVKSYDHKEHKARLIKDFIDKGIPQVDKGEAVPPIIACRVATMGRLSELKLVDWSIDEDSHSKYRLTKGEKYYELIDETLGKKEEFEKWKKELDDYLGKKRGSL